MPGVSCWSGSVNVLIDCTIDSIVVRSGARWKCIEYNLRAISIAVLYIDTHESNSGESVCPQVRKSM